MNPSSFLTSGMRHGVMALGVLLCMDYAPPLLHAQSQVVMPAQGEVAYLGITMEDVTAGNMGTYKLSAERGVIVRSVEPRSPAATAKLQENDVILEFGGFPAWSAVQLGSLVRQTPPGRKVDVALSREGRRMTLTVELGKRNGALSLDDGGGTAPPDSNQRGFGFIGPDGRSFRFNVPEGRIFGFQQPNTPGNPQPQRQRLGVSLQPLSDQLAEFLGVPGKKGALVASTQTGSPAAGKLKAGDVIIKADNQTINQPEDLIKVVQEKDEGALELRVIRAAKEITVTVELSKDPNSPSRGFRM